MVCAACCHMALVCICVFFFVFFVSLHSFFIFFSLVAINQTIVHNTSMSLPYVLF